MIAHQEIIQLIHSTSARGQLFLAVSGGVDSIVMMHIFYALYCKNKISMPTVLYVDHQLQNESKEWGRFVSEKAAEYGFPYHCLTIECNNRSENEARERRYDALLSCMQTNDILVLAHHLNDQYETFTFRAFRGSGLHGLTSMKASRAHKGVFLVRPLLEFEKADILKYAQDHGLNWVDDPSNQSHAFTRNRIRSALSQIKNKRSFLVTLSNISRQSRLLAQTTDEKLASVLIQPHIMDLVRFEQLSSDWQEEVFHLWLKRHLGAVPRLQERSILQAMLCAKNDKYPTQRVSNRSILRYRDTVSIIMLPQAYSEVLSSDVNIVIPGSGSISNPDGQHLSIRMLLDQKGRYKKKLQTLGIPDWLRVYIPVIEVCGVKHLATDSQLTKHNICWHVPKEWEHWFSSIRLLQK